jgi:hypothetical protein
MKHQRRHLLPREAVDEHGRFEAGDEFGPDCRVVDISPARAALELLDPTEVDVEGRTIVPLIHLRRHVKHTRTENHHRVRVATEFSDLSDRERTCLTSRRHPQAHRQPNRFEKGQR